MLRLILLLCILVFIPPCESRAQCTEDNPCPEVARLGPFIGGGVPAVAGGSFGAGTAITGNNNTETLTTVSTSSGTLNVAGGDLIVAVVAVYGWNTTAFGINDGGSNTLTMGTPVRDGNTDQTICYGYKINATANATAAFAASWTNNGDYPSIIVYKFTPTGTVSFDQGPSSANGTSGTNPTSGAIDPTAAVSLIIGIVGTPNYKNYTTPLFNEGADAADGATYKGSGDSNYNGGMWYKVYTSDPGSLDAEITTASTGAWVANIFSFKAE